MRAMPIALLALTACGGPNEETLVDELRVLAMVAEPPEVAPGAAAAVDVVVADPEESGVDVLFWTCASLGEGCLEHAAPGLGATVAAPTDGHVRVTRTAPVELAGIVGDGVTVLPIPMYALACAPGVCPLIDVAATSPAPGTADADTLAAFLEDPFTGMESLALTGTSLGFSLLSVSTRVEPVVNPLIALRGDPPTTIAVEGELSLVFDTGSTDDLNAWGYGTAGGFTMPSYAPEDDGSVTLKWIAPVEPGLVRLWVVVVGEAGGSAVWEGQVTVE